MRRASVKWRSGPETGRRSIPSSAPVRTTCPPPPPPPPATGVAPWRRGASALTGLAARLPAGRRRSQGVTALGARVLAGLGLAAALAVFAAAPAAAYYIKSPESLAKDTLNGATVTLSTDNISGEYFSQQSIQNLTFWTLSGVPDGTTVTVASGADGGNYYRTNSPQDAILTLSFSGDFTADWNLSITGATSLFNLSDYSQSFGSILVRVSSAGLRVGSVSGQATEAGGTATFPVRLWSQPSSAVTVSVTSRDSSEGTVEPSSLVFNTSNWNTAQTVTVTGVNDNVDDGTVTWQVRLDPSSGDANYNGLANVDVDVTTTDNDGAPGVTLLLDPASVAEMGGVATVTARLSHGSGAVTTLTVAAVAGAFTVGTDATIVIPAEATAAPTDTVLVTAVDNTTDEPNRTAAVGATVANDRATADSTTMSVTGATLTLEDDDAGPGVTLAVNPASIAEPSGVSTVTATLSHPSSEPSTVTVTPVSGAYTAGTDATIVIAAGATTAASDTATIVVVDDDLHHGNAGRGATVTASLANGQGAGSVTGASLTITDDENLPTASLLIDPLASSISENGGIATVTAQLAGLSGKSSEATTVTVTVTAVASSGAVAGDFTQTGTTLTIAAGSRTSTGLVTVTGVDNNVDAANKLLRLSATAAGGNGIQKPGSHRADADQRRRRDGESGAGPVGDYGERRGEHGDGAAVAPDDGGGDADGGGGGGDRRGGGGLQPVEHDDADHRGQRDHQHGAGDGDGGGQRRGFGEQAGDGIGDGGGRARGVGPVERDADPARRRVRAVGERGDGPGDGGRRRGHLHGAVEHAAHGGGDGGGDEPGCERGDGVAADADVRAGGLEHGADGDGDGGSGQHRRRDGDVAGAPGPVERRRQLQHQQRGGGRGRDHHRRRRPADGDDGAVAVVGGGDGRRGDG